MRHHLWAAAAAFLFAAPATAAPRTIEVPGSSRILPARPGVAPGVRSGRIGNLVMRPGLLARPSRVYGAGLYGAAGYGSYYGAYGSYGGLGAYDGFPSGLFGYNGPRDIHDLDITRGSAVAPGAPGNYRAQVGSPVIYAIEGSGRRGRALRACGEQLLPLAGGEEGGATLTRVTLC